MADFAPNFTPRIKIAYSTLNLQHTFLFRVPRLTTPAELAPWFGKITAWLNAINTARYTDFALLGTQFAAQDSDLFFPVGGPAAPVPGTVALPAPIRYAEQANMLSFPGRSIGGHRAINYIFSVVFGSTAIAQVDARLTSLESAVVAAAVNTLNQPPAFVANDNFAVTYYPYVNLKQSSYITRRARG